MAAMAISAEFPLGVYNGHSPDGEAESLPELARLFSALTNAAAQGVHGTGVPDDPYSQSALEALQWLEQHPPTAMRVPPHMAVSDRTERIAYRKEGVFKKEGKSTVYKTTGRRLSDGTAFAGAVQWIWDEPPRRDIILTLDDLCADVPYLGETSSPVELSVTEPSKPTHVLDPKAGLSREPGEFRQSIVTPGRLAELDRAHAQITPNKPPTRAADKHNTSTMPGSPLPSREALTTGVYRPVSQPVPMVPWSQVLSVPVLTGGNVADEAFVEISVALHQALVSKLGRDASPEITGHYPPGETPPANRVAIHFVPGDVPQLPFSDGRDRFLVLVPRDISSTGFSSLVAALNACTHVVSASHRLRLAPDKMEVHPGDSFWNEVPAGCSRSWEASPGFVPERHTKQTGSVSAIDLAGSWSLANIMRDLTPDASTGTPAARHAVLADYGVRVQGRALRTLRPRAFVHRTSRRNPVQPFRLSLSLGNLLPNQAIAAIGQSRHLGCGLLLPIDIPVTTQEQP